MPAAPGSVSYYRSLSHDQRIDALTDLQRQRAAIDAAEQRLLAVIDTNPAADPEHREIVLASKTNRTSTCTYCWSCVIGRGVEAPCSFIRIAAASG